VAIALERERTTNPGISADLVAQHYARNHSPDRAIRLWQEAAEEAVAKSAHNEAVRLLDQALALVPELGGAPERSALELQLTAASAAALRSARGYAAPEVEARYIRACELCDRIVAPQMRFNVEWGLFQCYFVKGDLTRACDFAGHLMANTRQLSDAQRADARLATGMVHLAEGRLETARVFLEQAVELTDPVHDAPSHHTHGQNPGIFARSNLAHALTFLGFADEARELIASSLRIARERLADPAHQLTYINALVFASRIYFVLREPDAVNSTSEELLVLARNHHYPYYEAIANAQLGWALGESGTIDEGIEAMRRGIRESERTGTRLATPGFHIGLAELLLRNNEVDAARELVDEAVRRDATGVRVWDAEVRRVRALALMQAGSPSIEAGESEFQSSLRISRSQSARLFELRAALSYAQLLYSTGRHAAARDCIQSSLSFFSGRQEIRDVVAAREMLMKLDTGDGNGCLRTPI
jgi:tetratricopeptide (TPR) repeat protein